MNITYDFLLNYYLHNQKIKDNNKKASNKNYHQKYKLSDELTDEEKAIRKARVDARNARRRELYKLQKEQKKIQQIKENEIVNKEHMDFLKSFSG
tara:strand:+ start:67 stop:351 length:285 start_codon:yes stop_codon:yes gene_type:complete